VTYLLRASSLGRSPSVLNETSDINRSTYSHASFGLADRGVTRADVDHPDWTGHSGVKAELVEGFVQLRGVVVDAKGARVEELV
jgi:hypothetical protein